MSMVHADMRVQVCIIYTNQSQIHVATDRNESKQNTEMLRWKYGVYESCHIALIIPALTFMHALCKLNVKTYC